MASTSPTGSRKRKQVVEAEETDCGICRQAFRPCEACGLTQLCDCNPAEAVCSQEWCDARFCGQCADISMCTICERVFCEDHGGVSLCMGCAINVCEDCLEESGGCCPECGALSEAGNNQKSEEVILECHAAGQDAGVWGGFSPFPFTTPQHKDAGKHIHISL